MSHPPLRRPALVAAAALLAMLACTQGAARRPLGLQVDAGTTVYANDDALTVVSPWADVRQQVSDEVAVSGGWTADVISTASVDIITAATSPYRETRNEGRVSVEVKQGEVLWGAGYIASIEPDTHVHTGTVHGQVDLLSRRLTVGLTYGLGYGRIGTWQEPKSLWRDRWIHDVVVVATGVLDRNTVAGVSYTFEQNSGDLASAYRRVPLFPADEALWERPHAQWVAERHPSARGRHAFSLTARRALTDQLFLRATWRGYFDTWAIRSHAGEVGFAVDFGPVGVEVSDRFNWQSRASFYRSVYTVNRELITADRRLGELMTNIAALAVRPRVGDFELVVRGELQWTRYVDHYGLVGDDLVATPDTLAGVGQVGVRWTR